MKHLIALFAIFLTVSLSAQEINWVDIETAAEMNKKEPEKKLFIDFYTSWCGWCKKMDKSTFKDPSIVERLNSEFIPVKFDAEGKESITYGGKEYKFVKVGRRGVHTFANYLLQGGLSYPSFVILDEKNKTASIVKGFQSPDDLHVALDGN